MFVETANGKKNNHIPWNIVELLYCNYFSRESLHQCIFLIQAKAKRVSLQADKYTCIVVMKVQTLQICCDTLTLIC